MPRLQPALLDEIPWDLLLQVVLVAIELLAIVVVALTLVLLRLRWRNRVRSRKWSRLEREWEPALLEVLFGVARPDALSARVPRRESAFFLGFLTRYAERLRGPERQRLQEVAAAHLYRAEEELRHPRAERRAQAVKTLGLLGLPDRAHLVIAALDDPAPLVRVTAAFGLLSQRPGDWAREVVGRIESFGPWSADFVAGLLAGAGGAVAPCLIRCLDDPATPQFTASVAAYALRLIADPRGADAAARALERRGERDVVAHCLRLLGAVGRAEHLPVLRRFAADSDFAVRAQAVRALGEVGGDEDVWRLTRALGDPSPWVALKAARGLARMGEIALLLRLSESDVDGAPFARQIVSALGA